MSKVSVFLFVLLAVLAFVSANVIKIRQLPRQLDMFGSSFEKRVGDVVINSYMSAQFYGPATIGGQEFNFIWDTGSSNVWVLDSRAANTYSHPSYNSSKSQTYQEVIPHEDFVIQYVSGAVSGEVIIDDVIAGSSTATAKSMKIGAVTDVSALGMAFAFGKFDGIIGLGFRSISINNLETFMEIVERTMAVRAMFAFQLPVDDVNPGSLQIGSFDKNLYTGTMTYIPLAANNYWLFRGQGVSLGSTSSSAKYFVLDSGTSLIAGPMVETEKLALSIGATQSPFNKAQWFVSCSAQLPQLSFKVDDSFSFVLEPKDYVINGGEDLCIFGIMGVDAFVPDPDNKNQRAPIWILGDSIMKKYYSVFDIENNRIGVAVSSIYKP